MKFKKTTLPNGLRIITVPVKASPTTSVFVMAEVGSNYETKEQNGLSHFLEHMMFKATRKRPTFLDIGRELESLGAESNAATSNEWTYYYAKAGKKHFKKILDIVSDMYLNSTLPEETLDKERGVILQEISMYEDLPQRKVWDVLYKLLYGDVPAGHTVIGPKENIKRFSREDFIKYRDSHYIASRTVIIVAGNIDEKGALKEVKKTFKNIPEGRSPTKLKVKESQKSPALSVFKKKTDQTHLVLAFRSFPAKDKKTPVLAVLSYILGKGFSSRLFQKMREEMGACYYVRADVDDYTDHGILVISAGIEAKRTEEVVRELLKECKKISREPVDEEELNKAKEYLLGRLYMRLETTDELADFYASQEISTGKPKTPKELEKEIRSVTAKQVQKVARDIFRNNGMNLAIVGDIKNSSKLKKILSF